jgi:hypothetical protein
LINISCWLKKRQGYQGGKNVGVININKAILTAASCPKRDFYAPPLPLTPFPLEGVLTAT